MLYELRNQVQTSYDKIKKEEGDERERKRLEHAAKVKLEKDQKEQEKEAILEQRRKMKKG